MNIKVLDIINGISDLGSLAEDIKPILLDYPISKEMEQWFYTRTNKHINLVQKYCERIYKHYEDYPLLIRKGAAHDDSKFQSAEKVPYIYLTWWHKLKGTPDKFEYPKEIKDAINAATLHHVLNNSHHPESSSSNKSTSVINLKDRDKPPSVIVDATGMKNIDILECVADWCGMSEELGNTPKSWVDSNLGKRWKFTDEQSDFIYEVIKSSW